jgi:phosphoesterase RecJ-like protein
MIQAEPVFDLIENAENILLVSHRGPDGDTLGSAGAMAVFLRDKNKRVSLFSVNEIPSSLHFLELHEFFTPGLDELDEHDLIICLDCADLPQTGIPDQLSEKKYVIPIINIDHHLTNSNFGDINIVDANASATAEIVFELLKSRNEPLNKRITTCLLAGILTDTTYFSNAGTTENAVAAAAELLKSGAKIKEVVENTWCRHSPESLRMWGQILADLHYNEENKTVVAVIPPQDNFNKPEIFEGMANFLTSIYEAQIIMVLRQDNDNFIKCSLRTTKNDVDVSKIARKFGGGGHAKAAGFGFSGQLEKNDGRWTIR